MINANIFIGEPQSFKNKFLIYPPKVSQVLTCTNYNAFVKLLTITPEDIQEELADKEIKDKIPTPFEFLFINCYHNKQFEEVAKQAFTFFLHQEVYFVYEEKTIVVGSMKENLQHIASLGKAVIITEEDYFDFQNAIREAIGHHQEKPYELPDPNENPFITKMKEKARERDKIKAKNKSKNGISLSTSLVAICCMGIGITPLNIGEMSYAAIEPIMTMMQDKEKYDVDIRSLLAGADSKKIKPKYWIRNSDKE